MATMMSGSVRFDNVSDAEIAKAFDFKAKHEGQIFLNDTQWKQGGSPNTKSNVEISWSTSASYLAAHELINLLLGT